MLSIAIENDYTKQKEHCRRLISARFCLQAVQVVIVVEDRKLVGKRCVSRKPVIRGIINSDGGRTVGGDV
jgi:hypothetical protein